MSIDLIGVSHSRPVKRGKRLTLHDVNMHIEEHQRVAILGKTGAGIEELLGIICGSVVPSVGDVVITSEISWPIGETAFLSTTASLATNLRFIARIYEVDDEKYVERITEVAEITEAWNETLGAVDRDTKWRYAFALGICLPFDIYIFQTTEAPDREYREISQAIVDQLGTQFGIVVATTKADVARQYCDRAFVLDDGKITYYDDIEAAIAHLEGMAEDEGLEFLEEGGDDAFESDLDVM